MMKLAMSPAAAGLLRALLARTGIEKNRILLTEFRSSDWHSLTFAGERHRIDLRIPGPGAGLVAALLTRDLEEAEFAIPGHIVADIGVDGAMIEHPDGAVSLSIEALTVEE
jgi:hypothetical protein